MKSWTPLRPLKDYLNAPKTPGIYEIGIKKSGFVAAQCAAFGFHAAGYPSNFIPLYVGKSESAIRYRLGEHCRGGSKANRQIKKFQKELKKLTSSEKKKISKTSLLDGLYFTCIEVADPKSFEAHVRIQNFNYSWNNKKETKAAIKAEGELSKTFGYTYAKKAVRFVGG